MITRNLKFLLIMLLGATLFTACEPDDGTSTDDNPVLTLEAETGFVTGDTEVAVGNEFSVKLTAAKGDAELATLYIKEDGTEIPSTDSRINIEGKTYQSPMSLFSPDTEGFTYDITIFAHLDVSTRTYSFEVTDVDGKSSAVSFDVLTTGSPLTLTYNGSGNALKIEPGNSAGFNITANVGTSKLSTIEVLEDGLLYANATDLSFDGTNFDANPYTIPEAYQTGITNKSVSVKVPTTEGTYVYTVRVADEAGFQEEIDVTVIVEVLGTPVDELTGKLLFNKSGPSGTGGLDLDTGEGTGSSDSAAEIADLGGTTDWLQQIEGVNNSTLQYLVPAENGLSENFTFEGLVFKEDLAALTTSGAPFVQSNQLQVGDMILVSNGSKNYLIVVKEIVVTTTVGDNSDHYVFDIKS